MSAGELLWWATLAHVFGDYVFQTDHMAREKVNRWSIALLHAAAYSVPFVPVVLAAGVSPWALTVIGGTHALIDRYRFAQYVVWLKNQCAPSGWRYPRSHADVTGYHSDGFAPYQHNDNAEGCTAPGVPIYRSTWLSIITDNALHVLINAGALLWLR